MLVEVWIGSLAAVASTASFLPQAWKVVQTGRTRDISRGMYLVTVSAFALWTLYGVLLRQWPLIASNAICLLLSGFILVMKLLPVADAGFVADKIKGS